MPPIYAHDPFLAVHRALQAGWLDLPMAALSVACEGWMLGLIALAWFSWLERTVRGVLLAWWPALVALSLEGLLVVVMKEALGTPRPLGVYGSGPVHVLLEPLHQSGFPSGHAAAAAALATYATLSYGRRGAPLYVLALLGGVSRVYVGAHWVLDVLAGWAFGALLGAVVYAGALRLPGGWHLEELRAERRSARRRRRRGPLGSDCSPRGDG